MGRQVVSAAKTWLDRVILTLLSRFGLGYTAWRDTKAALLVFNRDRNTSTVLEGVAKTVKEHSNYKTERPTNSETQFRYIFGHRDDPSREIIIAVLVFDVPA